MNDRGATASIRFYFSFRSPYAWLGEGRGPRATVA